jgi:hypothetical protein
LVNLPEPVLYVHVADDGGVLAVDGESGRSAWIGVSELTRRLDALRKEGGSVLLSREGGSVMASPVLKLIDGTGLRIAASPEIHPDALRSGGATALMSAAYVGAVELARDLIDRGVDLDAQDDDGFTALMYAANAGNEELVRLLVGAGADVNQSDNAGSTPLMFAAQHGHDRIVKKLLASGAKAGARRDDGLTAHDFAIQNGHSQLAAVLSAVQTGADER